MAMAVGCFLFGSVMLVLWWIEMFSDSWAGKLFRELTVTLQWGRNITSVFHPAMSLVAIFAGVGMFFQKVVDNEFLMLTFGILTLLCLVVACVGMLPWRFPSWMYPQGQLEKRQRQQAERRAEQRRQTAALADQRTVTPSENLPYTVPSPDDKQPTGTVPGVPEPESIPQQTDTAEIIDEVS